MVQRRLYSEDDTASLGDFNWLAYKTDTSLQITKISLKAVFGSRFNLFKVKDWN